MLELSLGNYTNALAQTDRSLKLTEKQLGVDHPDTTAALFLLGRLHLTLGNLTASEPLYRRGLTTSERVFGTTDSTTGGFYHDLAVLKLTAGKLPEAKAWALKARTAEERALQNVLSFTSERQRLAYQRGQASYDLLATLGSAPELAELILRHKGIALDSVLEDDLVTRTAGGSEAGNTLASLQETRRQLALLQGDPPKGSSLAIIQARASARYSLEERHDEIYKTMARQVSGLGRTRRSLGVTLAEIQNTLPASTVLVECIRYNHYLGQGKSEPRYGVALIGGVGTSFKGTTPGEPAWVPLGPGQVIEQTVRAYKAAMRSGRKGDEAILPTLYSQLMDPIKQKLPEDAQTLIFAPDAELNFLNFSTLVSGADRFLGEDYTVKHVASGRDLLFGNQTKPAIRSLVAFANPAFSLVAVPGVSKPATGLTSRVTGVTRGDIAGLDFQPLPGTEAEAQYLRTNAAGWHLAGSIYVGQAATELEVQRLRSPAFCTSPLTAFSCQKPPATHLPFKELCSKTAGGARWQIIPCCAVDSRWQAPKPRSTPGNGEKCRRARTTAF